MKVARALLRTPRVLGAGLAALIVGGLGAAGCFVGSEGLSPPTEGFYFPTGLAASPGGRVLYVANSDFDLQYNGGTVQALDLQRLRKRTLALQESLNPREGGEAGADLRAACGSLGINAAGVLYPGPCGPLDVAALGGDEAIIRSSAVIGAFASNVVLVHRPLAEPAPDAAAAPQARLFVPVRGDPSITFFEVADDRPEAPAATRCGEGDACFRLDCGATTNGGRCSVDHRVGEIPSREIERRKLPLEPLGISAGPDGESLVVSHHTENKASLIVNPWTSVGRPQLADVLDDLPAGPTELAAVPPPRLVRALGEEAIDYQPAFLLTYVAAPQVDLLRAQASTDSEPALLFQSSSTPITAAARGVDSRGVAVDASERQACEAGCADADRDCLARCAEIPVQAFVAHRNPNALLVGELTTTLVEDDSGRPDDRWAAAYETLAIRDTAPLAAYPTRVAVGDVIGVDGARRRRVFALAFDSGHAFVYDPAARRIDAVIRTGRGPQAVAFDTGVTCGPEKERCDCTPGEDDGCEPYSLMYIAHFTDSYLGVVDLDMRKANTFGSMILTVGKPVPPRESQ
ncbi:hypothetical protein SOCEGT47_028260 [Sorangium cellulosum]|uniref:Uncharacterized protein n=1 Tax=Sorangium cellulosum TaxID=56 RepID=A0A4P2PZJ0_SORCE|nr:hypothetical protein [Sorangium cellulosum]AUX22325.1 hypothetical protein SOCEGT47_028260 [Sorangium cellulosum]